MPKNHVKPTQEELAELERIALEEGEKQEEIEKELVEKAEEILEEPIEEPEEEVEPSQEIKEALKVEVKEKDKKLSASARENQKIYAKNRVINKALADAEEAPEPTEEELTKEFKDWDIMSDFEKTLAKETVVSRNWRKTISQAKEQATKIEKWNDSVNEFVDDPATLVSNPELEGRVDAFKEFAQSENNNSVPMNILVSAFLHEQSKASPKRGKMFPTSTGGPNERPNNNTGKLSMEDARKLRETDYGKWRDMLKAGKIESEF